MSRNRPVPFLDGWRVRATGSPEGVAARGARALAWLGASTAMAAGGDEMLEVRGRGNARVMVTGWEGERAARERCGIAAVERRAGDPGATGPGGMLVAQYVGTLAAAAALQVARGSGRELRVAAPRVARGLVEGVDSATAPTACLLRCADGWLVARWRRPAERRLFVAVLAANGLDLRRAGVEAVWKAVRACRLLVAPVRPADFQTPLGSKGPDRSRDFDGALASGYWTSSGPGDSGQLGRRSGLGPLRVVDWTALWAGPWATGRLADQGHLVTRIEPPARRDGPLRTPHGRDCWRRWNGAKSLALLDAREPGGGRALRALVAGSDVLVTGMTPRVLPQLGFDESWFARRAPRPLRVELVGFDEPNQELPAVGEQAAAMAGLLCGGEVPDGVPFPPLPWPDPLLGAKCLLVIHAWDAAGRPPGARLRLSLEGAARDALAWEPARGTPWPETSRRPPLTLSRRAAGAR